MLRSWKVMFHTIKRLVAYMPIRWQQGLKRKYYAYKIYQGRFHADEPEYQHLESFISKGDWVLDIGANIGHYTLKFSSLVGENGRVFAIEPVPETFELLAANVQRLPFKNVTLLNVAASDHPSIISMEIPFFDTGLRNYFMASISENKTGIDVYGISIDSLSFFKQIQMVKIDVEGHELQVLQGMVQLLQRDRPILIIETDSQQVFEFLKKFGYDMNKYPNSPNYMFRHSATSA